MTCFVFYLFRLHNDNSISHDQFYTLPAIPKTGNCLSFCKISQDIKGFKGPSFPSRSLFLLHQTPTSSSYKNNSRFRNFSENGKIGKNTEEKDEFCNDIVWNAVAATNEIKTLSLSIILYVMYKNFISCMKTLCGSQIYLYDTLKHYAVFWFFIMFH